jgi:hypothetical protein
MNDQLQQFARAQITEGLADLPPGWVRIFKLMYGRNDGRRSVDDAIAMDISEIVAQIPSYKLDWAMQQVENSLAKLAKSPPPSEDSGE